MLWHCTSRDNLWQWLFSLQIWLISKLKRSYSLIWKVQFRFRFSICITVFPFVLCSHSCYHPSDLQTEQLKLHSCFTRVRQCILHWWALNSNLHMSLKKPGKPLPVMTGETVKTEKINCGWQGTVGWGLSLRKYLMNYRWLTKASLLKGDKVSDLSHQKCVYQGIQRACLLTRAEATCLHLLALQLLATKLGTCPREFALRPHVSCDKTSPGDMAVFPLWFVL